MQTQAADEAGRAEGSAPKKAARPSAGIDFIPPRFFEADAASRV
jgi:hypothetical protein